MVLPNQLTTLRIILTPVFLYLFLSSDPVMIRISFIVYVVAALTDWYDGWLARKFNYITTWGKFMDPLADKILTSAVFLGFLLLDMVELWMVIIIVARDLFVTLIRLFADYKKIKFTTSRIAKTKTFLQMSFLYYLLFFYVLSTFDQFREKHIEYFEVLLHPSLIYWLMFIVTTITAYTGIDYLVRNRKLINELFLGSTKSI